LASCHAKVEIMRYLGLRLLTAYLRGGDDAAVAAIFKLYWSEYHQDVTSLALSVLGADVLAPTGRWPSSVAGPDDAGVDPNDSASWVGTFFNARAGTIYSGTSQIQRNLISERVLGLPREPSASQR
jgi:alkylation response protein AidB-like acyl-CoA dehydrogenase